MVKHLKALRSGLNLNSILLTYCELGKLLFPVSIRFFIHKVGEIMVDTLVGLL